MAEGEVQKNEEQRWTAKRRAALVLQTLKGVYCKLSRVLRKKEPHSFTSVIESLPVGKMERSCR